MQQAKTDQLTNIHIHIEPSRGWILLKLRELWAYRELLYSAEPITPAGRGYFRRMEKTFADVV